jgi:N-acetylglutamate synthase-like GNAT family acetyltransferase
MKIRAAKPADVDAMVDIIAKTFSKGDAKDARKEITEIMGLQTSKQVFVLAQDGKDVIGLAGMAQSWLDFNICEIFWVAVRPDRQGTGVGALLIADLLKRSKGYKGQDRAHAVILSTDSPGFFKKCGFKTIDTVSQTGVSVMIAKND